MVHAGNSLALSYSDNIVGHATINDNASINYKKGNRFKAVFIDFSGNLFLGSIPQSAMGLGIIFPFFTTAYQGWIAGIVSVDNSHQSRLKKTKSALYYFIVVLLQFMPYSLTIGAGLALGVKTYKLNKSRKLVEYRLDESGVKDLLNIYLLAIPMFFIASFFEFFSNWNI